ncbi:TPA: type I toxin-antitoxin system Hok family toxin [Klebsiella oxytoca]|uniref:Type I toxin-antitoxin system Hok family toxin n=1 Tax=Klebsiella oxytoca TaxID=571 RepID=A0AAN5RDF4_KLEOX|nr:type I toxin-antitoxin system Hok family toxin [Klebsiella oxytoca]
MLVTLKIASYSPYGKEKTAMEPLKAALIALIVVSAVCLGALLLSKKNLCDVSFRNGNTELVAHMAYESR